MSDQLADHAPSETAGAWDSARRVREPVAWALLALTAITVIISAWQLFGLPGAPSVAGPSPVVSGVSSVPVTGPSPVVAGPSPVATGPSSVPVSGPSPVPVATFGLRASAVAPQFVAVGIVSLPVLSVILVAFTAGLTDRARQVVQTAVSIQVITVGLGVLSWLGALGATPRLRPGIWFVAYATDVAVAAVALMFTVAVLRSHALRPMTPRFEDIGEDDADFREDDEARR